MSGGAYIEGNTLILGDSSYLEHHGIKGQRWGVRRFQNKDGSLTNAGRKRLGYSTRDVKKAVIKGGKAVGGAVATVGKTGYKLGKKAVVAAKARSDRKKAEKLEKKKEKASKTRLGVIANSDLFTAKEMEELNKKFKMQDEMTIASLKKGADIVTNIATIARGVNDINSAVENVTGKSLNPFKNASNETKRQKEAAELEQARQNAKKAASQAENEATKAEKAAYEFNKQKDHDKEKAAEKEAKKQQGKSTNDNKSDDDDKPKPPTGDKPKSPDDGGGKGGSADNSPTIPVVPVEYNKNESSGSNKNRAHTLSPEQQKKLVAFMRNKTKGPDDPGDVSDEDVAKYKQAAKDADQRAKSAQDNANNIKTQRDQLDAAIRNYKLPPQQDPNYDAALSQLRAASNRSSELTSAYKKAQSEADTAKANAYRAQREAVASEYGGSKGKNIAKDMAKRMSDASYQHEVDAIDNQRDSNKSAYDRNVAKEYIKDVLNPKKAINRKIDQVASKIADKAVNQQKEALAKERDRSRKQMSSNFEQAMKSGTLDADKAVREYYQREFNLHGAQLDKAVDNYMNAMAKRKTYRRAASHSAINLDSQVLVHYGIKGQRWGMRRFQNPDGTRTTAGKARYYKSNSEISGGGGGGVPEEEDDKAKAIAEALGIDVDDYRKKVDNSPLGYQHAADKLDKDAKKLHEQAAANRRMSDQAKSSGYKDKAREFERNAEKCETQAKSKEGLRDYCQWRADGGTLTKATANTINRTIDATKNAVGRAFDATANTVHDLNPGNYSIENKRGRIKIHKKPYVSKFAHGLLVDEDGTLYLEHHGIKGQRWGVRRFQNADGTLNDKGRKHYQKKLDREKRKQVSSDNLRGTLERRHGLAVGASGIISAITGALTVAAVVSNPATIAAGAAVAAAVSAGITHGSYSVAEAWEGRGSRIRKKKIAKYEAMLKQDAFVENNVLYLEHHGIKGQRWGVRRFQNPDGTLNEAGRKRYKKKIGIEERKVESLRAFQGRMERVKKPMSVAWAIVGAISGALAGVPAGPAGIAAGAAIVSAIYGGSTYLDYTIWRGFAEIEKGMRKKKIAKYEDMLKQDAFIVEDGALYLEHFGIKNMKWGVRRFQNKDGSLTEAGRKRYGSGKDGEELSGGGGGGGAPEEDEEMKKKIEEAAKKAGMTVAEYRKKYANVIANMKQSAKERKEGRQAELAKEAIYGKKEDHLPVLDNKLKLQGPKDAKEAMERYARSAETSRKAADAAYEYEKNNTNNLKDFDKWRNARYLGDSKFHQSIDAEKKARRAQAVYNNSKQAKIDEVKRKGAKAISDLKRNAKQTAKNVGSKLYDAAGGYHKKEAEEYAKAADDTLRYAQSVDRKGDADLAKAASARRKGNTGAHSSYATYGGNAKLVAKKRYEEASALRAGASKSKEKYEKSLAGRYEKLKATITERGKAKKKDGGAGTHALPKMKSGTATAKPMRKLTSKELSKIRSEARVKQLKKDGDYTGEYKKKRRK